MLFREIAAGRPGLITTVGIDTFIDPRLEGGRMNAVTTEDLVEVLDLEGEDPLLPGLPDQRRVPARHDRGPEGNVTMEREAAHHRGAVHRPGGEELRRHRAGPGGAGHHRAHAQPARGPHPRHPRRRRRGGPAAEPPADLRRGLQPGLHRRGPRAARRDRRRRRWTRARPSPAAARCAQAQLDREPRHRHARGHRLGRPRGAHPAT